MFSGLSTAANAISTFSNMFLLKHEKNMVLDPLTCIVRLAILSFKDEGTKISINNNKITFCDPSIWQGTLRLAFGDNREDLHNLYNPIVKATRWYSCENPNIKNLFELSVKGIDVLRKTYSKNSTIYHTLKLYIDIIKYKIQTNEGSAEDLSDSYSLDNQEDKQEDKPGDKQDKKKEQQNSDDMKTLNKIYTKLKDLWNERELSIINNLLIELNNKKNDSTSEEISVIFSALEIILNIKEKKVNELVIERSTIL